jgi:two-component system chemotaxis response regulator CheY
VRLLIVEDSALIRKVTRLAFHSREHELHEAENGLEAIGLVDGAAQPFDAIVLDLQMPDMNGAAFIRALRQRPQHRDTPIVVATSEGESSELLQEVRRLGVAGIVKKPWKPQELAAMVQQACADRSHKKKSSPS